MNRGQHDALMAKLDEAIAQLDEMRRALNRIDGRLRDMPDTRVITLDDIRRLAEPDGPDVSE